MSSHVGVIVLLGPPGSGKGTQAQILAQKNRGWAHISTGDLFRKEIASKSVLGLSLKNILDQGKLVSDEITDQIFESQLKKLVAESKPSVLLLDGYPRTEPQAKFLVSFCQMKLGETQMSEPIAIEFIIPVEAVVRRLADRWVNPRNGRIYHKVTNPPKIPGICDEDGEQLVQRPDDQPDTIRSRFKLYEDQRSSILRGLGLTKAQATLDAEQAPAQISGGLEKLIPMELRKASQNS